MIGALAGVLGMTIILLCFVPKSRDRFSVSFSASGFAVLAVSGATYWLDAYRGPEVWPTGSLLWSVLAGLMLTLKFSFKNGPRDQRRVRLFLIAYLMWILLTIGSVLMMAFVRHGITATYDEVVMYGILTLGLAQLGFAGIFEKLLFGSALGRFVWVSAVVIGSLAFIFSVAISVLLIFTGFATT